MDISNSDDIIDSRQVIERIEELEALVESEAISEDNGATAQQDENGDTVVDTATCGACGLSWNDALISGSTPAPSARCPYEAIHAEVAELKALRALQDEASGSPDWPHGEALIRDSYFEDYARQLAIDCASSHEESEILEGDGRGKHWPFTCMTIDWEAAAEALQQDYFEVDFDGVTYWIRS